MAGFALYQGGKYENSVTQYNRYLQLYPNGDYNAYVKLLDGCFLLSSNSEFRKRSTECKESTETV